MIAVVSHDAGGAEIVSSLILRQNLKCNYALFGPALSIFERKIGCITNNSIDQALKDAKLLICGTSIPTTYEVNAIALAHSLGIKSIAILEHWINYRERFIVKNKLITPDEIWVVDDFAEKIAKETFKEVNIKLIVNPYKEDFLESLSLAMKKLSSNSRKVNKLTVLYVTEPTSVHAERKYGDKRYWGYTEQEAVEYFFDNIKNIFSNNLKIIIRPHPSELASKYFFAKKIEGFEVHITKERELADEIAEADLIAGCNSMAMIVGTWARKRVVCCIPPGGRGFNLPDDGIEFLKDSVQP